MSAYTCITCRVAFADADLQRGHYKTDWHRYNLKRKVAEMPPVTAENFQQRVLAQRKQVAELEEDTSANCALCNKHFSTANTYENHIKSKKHKEAVEKQAKAVQALAEKRKEKGLEPLSEIEIVAQKNSRNMALKEAMAGGSSHTDEAIDEDDSDAGSEESWTGDALGIEECLFCSFVSSSLDSNVQHMTVTHSFFIPDLEFLVDLEGLITYLGQKVGEGNMCLWCNEKGRTFHSTEAVQGHMLDKGHCKMLHEGEALVEYADFYDYTSSYPEQQSTDGHENAEVVPDVLEQNDYELVLPSGTMVGHRSLQKYYKQNLLGKRVGNRSALTKVMAQYKALGWTGTTGVAAHKKAKDVAFVQRLKAKHHMRIGTKANKFQPHFRDDNFGIRH